MTHKTAQITIDRVVLTGLEMSPARADAFRAQLAAELGERIGSGEAAPTAGAVRVAPPPVRLAAGENDQMLAARVAESIVAALHAAQDS